MRSKYFMYAATMPLLLACAAVFVPGVSLWWLAGGIFCGMLLAEIPFILDTFGKVLAECNHRTSVALGHAEEAKASFYTYHKYKAPYFLQQAQVEHAHYLAEARRYGKWSTVVTMTLQELWGARVYAPDTLWAWATMIVLTFAAAAGGWLLSLAINMSLMWFFVIGESVVFTITLFCVIICASLGLFFGAAIQNKS